MPGVKMIRWDDATLETIMAARQSLVELGMKRPSIRATLYILLRLPGWTKKHYDTLTEKLGAWRDEGKIEFGLFADDGAGAGYRPLTSREIVERIQTLKDLVPAKLQSDKKLYVVFVEHISLVDTIADFLDYEVPVVSSQGQLRREHLHSFIQDCLDVLEELGGKELRVVGLTDYDKAGLEILETHRKWLGRVFSVELERWAVTSDQVRAAGLPVHDSHQLDGWMASYGPQRVRRELRRAVGIQDR